MLRKIVKNNDANSKKFFCVSFYSTERREASVPELKAEFR